PSSVRLRTAASRAARRPGRGHQRRRGALLQTTAFSRLPYCIGRRTPARARSGCRRHGGRACAASGGEGVRRQRGRAQRRHRQAVPLADRAPLDRGPARAGAHRGHRRPGRRAGSAGPPPGASTEIGPPQHSVTATHRARPPPDTPSHVTHGRRCPRTARPPPRLLRSPATGAERYGKAGTPLWALSGRLHLRRTTGGAPADRPPGVASSDLLAVTSPSAWGPDPIVAVVAGHRDRNLLLLPVDGGGAA